MQTRGSTRPSTPTPLFYELQRQSSWGRISGVVRNSRKETPQHQWQLILQVSQPEAEGGLWGPTSRADMHPCAASCGAVGSSSPQGLGSSQESPLPASLIWEAEWISLQFLDFSRMSGAMLLDPEASGCPAGKRGLTPHVRAMSPTEGGSAPEGAHRAWATLMSQQALSPRSPCSAQLPGDLHPHAALTGFPRGKQDAGQSSAATS